MHSGIILSDLSDHFPILSSLSCNMGIYEPKVHNAITLKVFNYNKIDKISNSFLIDKLEIVETETCPDIIANTIVKEYNEGISKYSYSKRVSRKQNTPRRPWVTSALLLSIEHKSSLFNEKIKHPTPGKLSKYNQYRNMLTNILRSAKRLHYQLELAKHSGNSKDTWKTLQSLINSKQNKDCVPSKLLGPNGDMIEDDKDIAEAFNSFSLKSVRNYAKTPLTRHLIPFSMFPISIMK